ncbi:MAG TPA: hypothetical protein ENN65_05945, partial [Candidatus Hydrogenedentes bacterium]|nr:hypothetical protein [Candidatus Hydrogenedentota bacterium]
MSSQTAPMERILVRQGVYKVRPAKEARGTVIDAVLVTRNKVRNSRGYLIEPDKISVERYVTGSPVIMYMHGMDEWGDLPIGRTLTLKKTAAVMTAVGEIAPFPELDWARRWIEEGYLNGISIGFMLD